MGTRTWTKVLLAFLASTTLPTIPARGQVIFPIDLASQSPGTTEKRSVEPGLAFSVTVLNLIPRRNYQVNYVTVWEEIPSLDVAAVVPATGDAICVHPEKTFVDLFKNVSDEKKVPGIIEQARTDAENADCNETQRAILESAIHRHTTRSSDMTFTLRQGQTLTVTVERIKDNAAERIWTRIYSTGSLGRFDTLYGFTFFPDRDHAFFTRPDPADSNQFNIFRQPDRKELDFAPSVFFAWRSAKSEERSWSYLPVAGLGFDLDNPFLFGGLGITFRRNLMLTLGGVFHQQDRLAGQFNLDEPVMGDPTKFDFVDSTYNLNPYVGVAFRFGANPFAERNTRNTPTPAPAPTPSGGDNGGGR